jgi:hypothetical protein
LLKDAAVYSQTIGTTVDIVRGGNVVAAKVPLISGDYSSDRGSKVRLNSSISIYDPGVDLGVEVYRFRVHQGYQSLGVAESILLGEFRIDKISQGSDRVLDIDGSGLESYIIDARFIQPRTPPYGVSTTGQIRDLILEVLPSAKVSIECSRDKPVQATSPWDEDRWDAIDALAASIDAEVFADYRGHFVIRDIPSLTQTAPVYSFTTGEAGTLISRDRGQTRDKIYNAVSVSGQSSDANIPPVWGWAYDSDPSSPTYYYGDFGQVPRFYTSQFFSSNLQCENYAKTLLAESLSANRSLSFTALPVIFLETGDVVDVALESGEVQRRIMQKMGFDLGPDGVISIDTLSSKDMSEDEF